MSLKCFNETQLTFATSLLESNLWPLNKTLSTLFDRSCERAARLKSGTTSTKTESVQWSATGTKIPVRTYNSRTSLFRLLETCTLIIRSSSHCLQVPFVLSIQAREDLLSGFLLDLSTTSPENNSVMKIKALPTQYELLKKIRKQVPKPSIRFKSKKQYNRTRFKRDVSLWVVSLPFSLLLSLPLFSLMGRKRRWF